MAKTKGEGIERVQLESGVFVTKRTQELYATEPEPKNPLNPGWGFFIGTATGGALAGSAIGAVYGLAAHLPGLIAPVASFNLLPFFALSVTGMVLGIGVGLGLMTMAGMSMYQGTSTHAMRGIFVLGATLFGAALGAMIGTFLGGPSGTVLGAMIGAGAGAFLGGAVALTDYCLKRNNDKPEVNEEDILKFEEDSSENSNSM